MRDLPPEDLEYFGEGEGAKKESGRGRGVKCVFWYIARLALDVSPTAFSSGQVQTQKVEGTQMAGESYESVWVPMHDAVERLTFEVDRDVVRKAVEIVGASGGQEGCVGSFR
jgi:hypothetical protein